MDQTTLRFAKLRSPTRVQLNDETKKILIKLIPAN